MTGPIPTGVTPAGLPYPESTEALNQGANAIKALALAVDPGMRAEPFLWVSGLGSVVYGATYVYTKVKSDARAGWNATNGRYTVAKSGLYLAVVKSQMNGSGGATTPGIQTAPTVGGTYTTQLSGAVTGTGSYQGNNVLGVLPLTAGNGVRVVELSGTGWTADTGSDGSNFFQLAYLGAP